MRWNRALPACSTAIPISSGPSASAVIACFVYLVIARTIVFKVTGALTGGIRVSPEEELEGVDIPEMGVLGYSGFQMDKAAETPISH